MMSYEESKGVLADEEYHHLYELREALERNEPATELIEWCRVHI